MCFIPRHIYFFFIAVSDFARGCFVVLFFCCIVFVDSIDVREIQFLFFCFFFFCNSLFLRSPSFREVMSFSSAFSSQSRFLIASLRKFVPHNSRRTTPRCDFVEFCPLRPSVASIRKRFFCVVVQHSVGGHNH